ncbi:MAG: segregation/condensation protein A [Candidatus Omnitrophota bacterium]
MSYKVKLNIFEGPLDLLLFLIKRDKIDIYDIPIAKVTQQYLDYMDLMKMLDLEIAGEFLVMAATLIHIKSKMLLPPDETDEEVEEEEDPRDELVRRLLEYKKYKEAASHLQTMHEEHKSLFLRRGEGDKGKIVSDDGTEYFEASLFDLITAFRKILTTVPKKTFHKVIKNEFTVSDKIHEIYHILAKEPKMYFSSLFDKAEGKDEVIVIFLAILELIKMREVFVAQTGPFEDIEILRNPELVKNDTKSE